MSNEIVKYHNDMNKVALNGFNKLELDLYAAIVSRMRNEELGLISFEFDYGLSNPKGENKDAVYPAREE